MTTNRKLRPEIDVSLLTDADQEKLRKKAQAEVLAARKKEVEEALLARMVQEEKAHYDVAEEEVTVTINIPAFATHLLIDGVPYNHGEVVTITRSMAASLNEQMARMWTHETASGNPNLRDYVPVKEDSFSALSSGFARV
jgi:hypothetical protein